MSDERIIETRDLMRTGGERRAVISHNLEQAGEAIRRLQGFFNGRSWDQIGTDQLEAIHQDFMMACRTRQRAELIWTPLADGLHEAIMAQEAADQSAQAPS